MKQYIDKAIIMAEILRTEKISKDAAEKAVDTYFKIHFDGWATACRSILSFIDALEVKEVDLEKEIDDYTKDILACDVQFEPFTHLYNCAKYFYELGLKAKGE